MIPGGHFNQIRADAPRISIKKHSISRKADRLSRQEYVSAYAVKRLLIQRLLLQRLLLRRLHHQEQLRAGLLQIRQDQCQHRQQNGKYRR